RFRPRIPQTATTMRLTSGTLRGRKRQEEWQAVLTVERDSSVAIVARNGNRIRTMELAASVPSVTIGNVYANSGELGVEQRPLADNHWLAFYTLAGMPVLCDVPVPPNPSPNRRDPHAHTTIACSVSQYP
ncbi:MAG TPA: hypothetical protein VFO89_11185, partial [Thermoanaerobaculia bacterium]|nr:hypothetical protein [Thermoanaerobaculia bacterium]